jgi:hypothetical protein
MSISAISSLIFCVDPAIASSLFFHWKFSRSSFASSEIEIAKSFGRGTFSSLFHREILVFFDRSSPFIFLSIST